MHHLPPTPASARLRIAFVPLGTDWPGGQSLVTNAIRALHDAQPGQVHIQILGDASGDSRRYAGETGADGVVVHAAPGAYSPRRVASAVLVRLRHQNLSLGATLAAAGVQVLVGEGISWRLGPVATVGWLQDFQHVHLPALFTAEEIAQRDRKFRDTMRLADRLLAFVAVADDARTFAPEYAHKVRPIRPYALVDPSVYARDCAAVLTRYDLPERFVYVPNQFWIHKNHLGLLQAVRILRARGVRPCVVFTGHWHEYRDPQHFATVTRAIADWQLEAQIRNLGLVPRTDVYDLMRQALCVLNPSLFEGWGYSVDEAAAVGKRILASDIAAHRAQRAPACDFFDPHDPEDLAAKLERLWQTAEAGPSLALECAARQRMPQRVEALGQTLFGVLNEAVAVHRRGAAA